MASSSDPTRQQEAVLRKQNKGPPFKFLVPLVYAPVLPLIRLSLRHKPVLRDRLFTIVLAGAFAHGFYLVNLGDLNQHKGGAEIAVLICAPLVDIVRTDIYDAESK